MATRFAVTSALALAAALLVAPAAQAEGFFFSYQMSPRQIAGMLRDDGYELRGPMLRRGDIYVCDVVSISGRPARLIVDARNGHVLERFASEPRWRRSDDWNGPRRLRPPRDVGDGGATPDRETAMGDLFNQPSRVYGNDSLFSSRPDPDAAAKPKHHVAKKHKEPAVAKEPDGSPTPDAAASGKPGDSGSSSLAAVAPGAGAEPGKPEGAPKSVSPPDASQARAEAEKRPVVEPSPAPGPKTEGARKKLNDLPVGTLD